MCTPPGSEQPSRSRQERPIDAVSPTVFDMAVSVAEPYAISEDEIVSFGLPLPSGNVTWGRRDVASVMCERRRGTRRVAHRTWGVTHEGH